MEFAVDAGGAEGRSAVQALIKLVRGGAGDFLRPYYRLRTISLPV